MIGGGDVIQMENLDDVSNPKVLVVQNTGEALRARDTEASGDVREQALNTSSGWDK